MRADVSSAESANAMADQTVAEFGGIDHLVNNAAIFGGMKLDLPDHRRLGLLQEVHEREPGRRAGVTRAVYRRCKRGGGAIVNQSSTAAWLYSNFYGLAKVGINGLTQQLAHELGGQNIRVNAIAPGPIDTEATRTHAGEVAGHRQGNSAEADGPARGPGRHVPVPAVG